MLSVRRGLTTRRSMPPSQGSLWFLPPPRMAGNLRSIVAPDAQTRYWPSGDNTSDLPPKSLSEQSLVRALTPTGALSLGNYATILKTLVASNLLIKNDKLVVPVAGIEPATFGLQNRCSTI